MLTAIIVYLIIGGIIVLFLRNILADIVKDNTLAMKVIYCVWMIIIAPPLFIYSIIDEAHIRN